MSPRSRDGHPGCAGHSRVGGRLRLGVQGTTPGNCLTGDGLYQETGRTLNGEKKGHLFGELDAPRSRQGKGPGPEGQATTRGAFPVSERRRRMGPVEMGSSPADGLEGGKV